MKLYKTGKYDPFELNSIMLDKRSGIIKLIPSGYKSKNFIPFVLMTLFKTLEYFMYPLISAPFKLKIAKVSDYKDWFDNTILFRIPTLNNERALSGILEVVERERNNVKVMRQGVRYNNYPVLLIVLKSLSYLPSLWKRYRCSNYNDRRIISYFVRDFLLARGVTWFYFKILSAYRPECVVISNDHMYYIKSLELVCDYYNINTIYVQHASVSYAFPELHFTYTFLDGKDAFDKYSSDGKNIPENVVLLGAVRYDALSKYRLGRVHEDRHCIGIAINQLDEKAIVNNLCNALLDKYPDTRIKIRTHPALKNTPLIIEEKSRIIYTCATDEPVVDFFDDIDALISNDSGIHFDAFIAGIPTIAYNLATDHYGDNYGYVKSGILKLASDFEEVAEFVDNKDMYAVDSKKLRVHDESYGKRYAGKCSEILADFILNGYKMELFCKKYGAIYSVYKSSGYYVIPE